MSRIYFQLPEAMRSMLPSITAFGVLTACMAGYVALDRTVDQETATSRINVALQACPDIREAAEAIADKRTPTSADAARIVAMGRRAAGHVPGCRGLVREPAPAGSLIEEGYWLADRVMLIGDACPAVMARTNKALDDGKVELREAGDLMVSARKACPGLDARKLQ
jgi:hypothetical protein